MIARHVRHLLETDREEKPDEAERRIGKRRAQRAGDAAANAQRGATELGGIEHGRNLLVGLCAF